MDKLELEKVFSVAIDREIEAHQFYKSVADRVEDEEVKKVFMQLSNEEMGHMEKLELIKADPTASMKFTAPEQDYMIAEATEATSLSINMKPADAIALAMKKEQQAVEFYKKMSLESTDDNIKELFNNLSNMELNHKHRLENVFVDIGYPEAF